MIAMIALIIILLIFATSSIIFSLVISRADIKEDYGKSTQKHVDDFLNNEIDKQKFQNKIIGKNLKVSNGVQLFANDKKETIFCINETQIITYLN